MTTLKQGRWVKIHEQGRANFETAENVMGITFGDNRYQAEATYTAGTRTYRKAAYWMLRYLPRKSKPRPPKPERTLLRSL